MAELRLSGLTVDAGTGTADRFVKRHRLSRRCELRRPGTLNHVGIHRRVFGRQDRAEILCDRVATVAGDLQLNPDTGILCFEYIEGLPHHCGRTECRNEDIQLSLPWQPIRVPTETRN